MFKVQDNPDGSTSIYCKNSGNLLCTIPGKRNCNGPRRVNVVEPQPVATSQLLLDSNWDNLKKPHESLNDDPAQHKDEHEVKPRTRQSKCCLSPIPISVDGDQSEDYFDDCITQDEFAKCLNLISKEKLQKEPKDSILAEYPLRLLSRSKAYRTLEESPTEDLRDLKLPDDMPLTSCLGKKILHLNKSRNFATKTKMMLSLKRYDDYCRIPFNTIKPSTCNFPKLRCREKKTYPITSLLKSSKHEANHFYTYGRRQRLDRIITLKTGLDTRSRKLLRFCNRKILKVNLTKLTKDEIESWKKRPTISLDEEFSLVDPNLPTIESLRAATVPIADSSTLSLKEICALLPAGTSLLPLKAPDSNSSSCKELTEQHKKKCRKKWSVPLKQVTRDIRKQGDGFYYFKDTSIRIPFFKEFVSVSQRQRSLTNHKKMEGNKLNAVQTNRKLVSILKSVSTTNSSSSMSGFQNFTDVVTNCSETVTQQAVNDMKELVKNHRSIATPGKAKSKSSRSRRASPNESSRTSAKEPPVVDLTGDSPPLKEKPINKQPVPNKTVIASQWKFNCFRCGYKRRYLTYEPHVVETAVHEHMSKTHEVADPDPFLSRYIDRVNKCTVIEAFPGFKSKKSEP